MAMEGAAQSEYNSSTEGVQEHSSSPRKSQSPPPSTGISVFYTLLALDLLFVVCLVINFVLW